MVDSLRYLRRALRAILASSFLSGMLFAQSGDISLRGQVTDSSGAVVSAIAVTLGGSDGVVRKVQTNEEGRYAFRNLPPGTYTVRVQLKGFADFEKAAVVIAHGQPQVVDAQLQVTLERQQVTVKGEASEVSVSPTNNAGALVLRGADLTALSDNPDDLQDELQALAGPAAGPNGGQIYIDGFIGGRLPPKESIREIRVNQSPFAAEYDRLGFGRIEIFTKPGTDNFHGQASLDFGDSVFNSRNPFAPNKPPYQSRQFGGNVGGPLGKTASFFLDAERRNVDDVAVVSAVVIDPSYNAIPFSQTVLNPTWRTTISPRVDYQLSPKNTVTARYSYSRAGATDSGIGQFSLPSQGYDLRNTEQTAQVSETAMLTERAVNETRFQYVREVNNQIGDNSTPTISVLGAFTAGGVSVGPAANNRDQYEVQNITSLTINKHLLRFGGRLRDVNLGSHSLQNFNGAFTFTSIGAYSLTLQGLENGLTPAEIRAQGGGASQFSMIAGKPLASLNQFDVGLFFQDDWRVRPNLSLSAGLRYEAQNQISNHRDFTPRIGLAWGTGKKAMTVLRAGAGIFYDRVPEDMTLQALRLNGVTQQEYLVADPDFFPNIPSPEVLLQSSAPQTIRQMAPNLCAPYVAQEAIGVERRLPKNITVAVTYTNSHGVHILRSRNINAPLPGSYDPQNPAGGVRPYGGQGNIYQYESSGIFNQNQLIANISARLTRRFSLFGFYMLNRARSNTDRADSFPASQYDLSREYGPAAFSVRQRLFMGGAVPLPLGFRVSPFVVASAGRPFDIVTGQDLNGDSLFNDRPAFATDLSRPSVVETAYGVFDTVPMLGATIIPRNYGGGPSQFSINMHLTKTFSFGRLVGESAGDSEGGHGGHSHGSRGGPPGGSLGPRGLSGVGGPPHGMFHGEPGNRRYNLEITLDTHNVLNNVNLAPPIGNLSSTLFGQSNALAGGFHASSTANRRIELEARFSF